MSAPSVIDRQWTLHLLIATCTEKLEEIALSSFHGKYKFHVQHACLLHNWMETYFSFIRITSHVGEDGHPFRHVKMFMMTRLNWTRRWISFIISLWARSKMLSNRLKCGQQLHTHNPHISISFTRRNSPSKLVCYFSAVSLGGFDRAFVWIFNATLRTCISQICSSSLMCGLLARSCGFQPSIKNQTKKLRFGYLSAGQK